MPGNATPICYTKAPVQLSTTSDCADRVNRDLENLFTAIRQIKQCQASQADTLNALTNGAFSGGDSGSGSNNGSGTGTSGAGTSGVSGSPMFSGRGSSLNVGAGVGSTTARYSTPTSFTLPDGDPGGVYLIDATGNITVTLPYPVANCPITVINCSNTSNTITLQTNTGTTIEVVQPGGSCSCYAMEGAAGTPSWNTGAIVQMPDGLMLTTSDIYIDSASTGLVLKDAANQYWRLTISITGALTATSLGGLSPIEAIPA
jgi:hypothetical protein